MWAWPKHENLENTEQSSEMPWSVDSGSNSTSTSAPGQNCSQFEISMGLVKM